MRKLKPCLKPFIGCLTCGGGEMRQDPKTKVITCDLQAKMYGGAMSGWTVTRDGAVYYRIDNATGSKEEWNRTKRLLWFEKMASLEPDADWRAEYLGGLRDATYQRQGRGRWVLVKSGMGYA